MNIKKLIDQHEQVWRSFIKNHMLSEKQGDQFAHYLDLLLEWNDRINLTAITDVPDVIQYHFADSLALVHAIDMKTIRMVGDVGSGGGIPGIPLAIAHPHVRVVLIEVVGKRIDFLRLVAKQLGIDDRVEVVDCDWRTFLRTTSFPIELMCARASLRPDELVRMFRSTCSYRKARLVYWASDKWQVEKSAQPFFNKEIVYDVGARKRRLAIFENKNV